TCLVPRAQQAPYSPAQLQPSRSRNPRPAAPRRSSPCAFGSSIAPQVPICLRPLDQNAQFCTIPICFHVTLVFMPAPHRAACYSDPPPSCPAARGSAQEIAGRPALRETPAVFNLRIPLLSLP